MDDSNRFVERAVRLARGTFANVVRGVAQIVLAYAVNLPLFIVAVLSIVFIPLGVGVVLA